MTGFDPERVSPESFEKRYRAELDPWNYRTSAYERGKYQITLDSLSRPHYARAFEPACSIGELTAMLAVRCDSVLAIDVSATAVNTARERCSELANVQVARADLREFVPAESASSFDLIVLSEVGYYFTIPELTEIAGKLAAALNPGGELIAVHWRGHSPDHMLHADEVHRCLLDHLPLQPHRNDHHPGFRLDSWLQTS